jgi:soluble lytic murein transglycosylase
MRRMVRAIALLLALAGGAVFGAEVDLAAQRTAFASALALTRAGVAQNAEIEALQAYPLYPYLQAARLQRQVADAPDPLVDQQVMAFLDANAGSLWTRELRRFWLGSLADRAAWETFLRYYDDSVADAALRCQQLAARLQTIPEGASPDAFRESALARWLSPDDQPAQCNGVFGWLKEQGALTDDLVEQRARLALKYGRAKLAKSLAAPLPEERAQPLLRWAALIATPKPELEKLIGKPDTPVEDDAVFDAFQRLARADGADALEVYRKLAQTRHVPKQRRHEFLRVLATGLALDRQPEAIEYYDDLPDKALEERDFEWRLRAGLWNGEWKRTLKWLEHSPETIRSQSRWRYWRARALDETGKDEAARKIYEELVQENGYHSVLAMQRLDRAFTPHHRPYADNPEVQMRLSQIPALQRAREASAVGEYAWIGAEWKSGIEGLSAEQRLQAAKLAGSWGMLEQAVTATAAQQQFDDLELLYPRPYEREIAEGAALSGLPPELIRSVMRQESLYRPDAVSSANAIGLLQLLPGAARDTAKRWSMPTPTPEDLKKPHINVPLGSAHLREATDDFGGRVIFALCAYNAGPRPLRKWLPNEPRDAEIWIENIPYNETRTYVQRILWNMVVYRWRATGEPQTVATHLAPVIRPPPEGS